jgi:hypothetical protein
MKLIFISFFLCVLIWYAIPAYSDRTDSVNKVLKNSGYTEIESLGFSLWGCSRDDYFRTKFKAVNLVGNRVSGYVCEGILKGKTIRLD